MHLALGRCQFETPAEAGHPGPHNCPIAPCCIPPIILVSGQRRHRHVRQQDPLRPGGQLVLAPPPRI
jgi:hypothetical protein